MQADTGGTSAGGHLIPPALTAEMTEWQKRLLADFMATAPLPPRFATPLPWRTQLRLAFEGRIDAAAIGLSDRGYHDAALRLWRVTRLIRRT